MKIRYSTVRHNISVGNDGCVSVLSHTGQNYSSPIFSTHIQALTGWNSKAKELEVLINQNLLAIE
ncbi:MAG: hypothetical protein IPM47_04600 [Sphingobacteriales bacterium]|nr:MAG: hypothetical protein IPM47_04600 [Sphingobacteriales bacterium]